MADHIHTCTADTCPFSDYKHEIGELRSAFTQDVNAIRADVKEDLQGIRDGITQTRITNERVETLLNSMLAAPNGRLVVVEADVKTLTLWKAGVNAYWKSAVVVSALVSFVISAIGIGINAFLHWPKQ